MKRVPGLICLCAVLSVSLYANAQQWTPPTPEELSMTEQKEVPGAPAVYLYREETTDDNLHMFSIYTRLKVLTERGKDYANVELPYMNVYGNAEYTVDYLYGRTIHPDGAIIPFAGKPIEKIVEKTEYTKYMTEVMTLSDVTVGSIIEYRYRVPIGDRSYNAPEWFIQTDLYTRSAHYLWTPTGKRLVTHGGRGDSTKGVAWTPVLPEGAEVKQIEKGANLLHDYEVVMSLDVHDIPPAPVEEMMPPIKSFTYRVLFYYAAYRNKDEYWKNEGKYWAREQDEFIGPGRGVKDAIGKLTAPGDTEEQKLRKLYAAVMEMENTDFTRQRSRAEDKANKLKQISSAEGVLQRKRGTSDQLNALFVAMARAAGMKAYVMAVTNRDRSIFSPAYMSMVQLDDEVAIVVVDGKEKFFDPGSRYAAYGHLAWKHSSCGGVRQVEGGAVLATSAGEAYTASQVQRVANLKMDEQGVVSGTVKLVYTGDPALHWRQVALAGDETSVKRELKTAAERMLPGGMEVEVSSVEGLTEYEKPLTVQLTVKGAIGSPTGRRLLVPVGLFEGNTRPLFSHERRELPVYFEYGEVVQDAVRINFPAGVAVESLPGGGKETLKTAAVYTLTTEKTTTSVTARRMYALGQNVFLPEEYQELRSFYTKMAGKDQESIVLTRSEGKAGGVE